MVRVVGITGSLREGSVSTQMVNTVLAACKAEGAEVDLIDLRQHPRLPFCDGRSNREKTYSRRVNGLRDRVKAADALVVGTPEYHGGYSGVLKNFLDLNPADSFRDKPVVLVSAGGSRFVSKSALTQLQGVMTSLGAMVLPKQAAAGPTDLQDGVLSNQLLIQRLRDIGRSLVRITRQIRSEPSPRFGTSRMMATQKN